MITELNLPINKVKFANTNRIDIISLQLKCELIAINDSDMLLERVGAIINSGIVSDLKNFLNTQVEKFITKTPDR